MDQLPKVFQLLEVNEKEENQEDEVNKTGKTIVGVEGMTKFKDEIGGSSQLESVKYSDEEKQGIHKHEESPKLLLSSDDMSALIEKLNKHFKKDKDEIESLFELPRDDRHLFQVKDMTKDAIVKEAEALLKYFESELDTIPMTQITKVVYNKSRDRQIIINHGKKTKVQKSSNNGFAIHHILKMIIEWYPNYTQRSLKYSIEAQLGIKNQIDINLPLNYVASSIGCRRDNLPFLVYPKGRFGGNIKILYKNKVRLDPSQWVHSSQIAEKVSNIEFIESTAPFILLVEKHCMFVRFTSEKFQSRFPCIVISGEGMPTLLTRKFLHVIYEQFKIPILGLFDCDPSGIDILSAYRFGTTSMAYDSNNLTCQHIKWLGIRPTDLDNPEYENCPKSNLTKRDHAVLRTLMLTVGVWDTEWGKQLAHMIKKGKCAGLDWLNELGGDSIVDYVMDKIENNDYI